MTEEEKTELRKVAEKYLKDFNTLDYELNDELRKAILMAELSEKNLIISGSAGTGKSTFIELLQLNSNKNYVILAPTGVAAVNVGGVTVHSFFKFPHGIINKYAVNKSIKDLVMKLDAIIIDEISMVRADMMDAIDYQLRVLTGNAEKPFGGIKIIAIGDLFQLPPIVQKGSPDEKYISDSFYSPWFFSAPDIGKFTIVELKKIYRQNDEEFRGVLNKIRIGKQSWNDLKYINQRVVKEEDFGKDYVYLSTTNKVADEINQNKLNELPGITEYKYSKIYGTFPPSMYPTLDVLQLKVGAQIMMLRNTPWYYNGQVGSIIALSKDNIAVELEDGSQYFINPETWFNYEYELKDGKIRMIEKGSFAQYAIKLAWAITIHKSQSKTYNKVYIDLGNGAFSAGQTYVALSRCKTLGGIGLKYKVDKRDIIVDRTLKEYFMPKLA